MTEPGATDDPGAGHEPGVTGDPGATEDPGATGDPGTGRQSGATEDARAAHQRGEAAEPPLRKLTPTEKVVRSFFRDDRLVSIPAKPAKRDLLLPVIRERCFPDDRDYEEKEVNMRLALLHSDVAALRRYLIDGGWMTRSGGIYRRGSRDS